MPDWSETFSRHTMIEVRQMDDENRRWRKELRREMNAMIERKLAKEIRQEEYDANREHFKTEIAECERRGVMLAREIANRRR